MIKRFCDVCGKEIVSRDESMESMESTKYVSINGKQCVLRVMIGIGNLSSGDLCKDCGLQAITDAVQGGGEQKKRNGAQLLTM